jgi:putative membrane protein
VTSIDPRLEWQRTSPMAIVFYIARFAHQVVTHGLPAMIGLLAAAAAGGERVRTGLLLGVVFLAALGVLGSLLSYLRFRFRIVDDRVLVRSGVLHREELDIEFSRVQNVTIREPFYMRPFGLALLAIDTAGSGQKEIVLGGITQALAQTLRETILANSRPPSSGDTEEPIEEEQDPGLLLTRSSTDIIIYGLTINFLLWVAVIFGALSGYGEEVFGKFVDQSTIERFFVTAQSDFGLIASLMIGIALMFAALLLLSVIGVAGALVRHYGYRLTVDGETYRKHSGLLSRHDESLKRHKIQAVVWKQNFMAQRFGRINMLLRQASAGSGVENGQLPTGPKSAFLVPALHPDEAVDLSAEFFPDCQSDQVVFSAVNRRRFIFKTLAVSGLPVAVGISILPTILVSWLFVLLIPLVLALAYLLVHQQWKRLGYGVVGEYGFVRSGIIGTETTVFPLFKVQRVDIRQTPSQRRHGLANLTIHLASHSLSVPYIKFGDADRFRNLALYHAESTNRRWY